MAKKLGVAACVGALLGTALTWYLKPPQTRTEILEQEVVRTDVRTVTKIVERPGGVKETTIEQVDKSKSAATKQVTETKILQKNWIVGLGAMTDYKLVPLYQAQVSRRVLGPLFFGVSATTNGYVGAQILMEF